MSGILSAFVSSAGITTSTFNITVATLPSTTLVGYSDGTAGTSGGAAGSITGGAFGGKDIAEISYINSGINVDRLRVKGFSANPGQAWMSKVVANSITRTGASATYAWDAVNLCATWQWAGGSFGFANGNTYNGNTIVHSL